MNSSGALSSSTRDPVMQKLFDPVNGIGLGFVRNPMGASDLARNNYSFDDTCCDLNDFSINHDLADVVPLTKQAKALNPALKVMASPWSAPAWMKDNNAFVPGLAAVAVLRGCTRSTSSSTSRRTRPRACTSTTSHRRTSRPAAPAVPVDELERLRPALLHQEQPAAGAPRRRADHQGARSSTGTGTATTPGPPRCSTTPPSATTRCSAASPGTATAATSAQQTTVHNQYPERERLHDRALGRHLDREPAERGHEQHHRLHPQLGS